MGWYRKLCLAMLVLVMISGSALPVIGTTEMPNAQGNDSRMEMPAAKVLYISDREKWEFVQERLEERLDQFFADLFAGRKVEVSYYTMKQFVTLREDVAGKYDVIMFGHGNYSSKESLVELVSTKYYRKNDITHYKANELIQQYIDKGVPVLFSTQTVNWLEKKERRQVSNFWHYFHQYWENTAYPNVILYNSDQLSEKERKQEQREELITQIQTALAATQWPQLQLHEQPVSYKEGQLSFYTSSGSNWDGKTGSNGNRLTYRFSIPHEEYYPDKNLAVKLYFDLNYDNRYDQDEMIALQYLEQLGKDPAGNYLFQVELPRGYSGLRYWKLELLDLSGDVVTVFHQQTGRILFLDRQAKISVLQVKKNWDDPDLTDEQFVKQKYLKPQQYGESTILDYEFEIDVVTLRQFNDFKHQELIGHYDMIIFGFKDLYNHGVKDYDRFERPIYEKENISWLAKRALDQFIASGQGVIFTHDTMYAEELSLGEKIKDEGEQKYHVNDWLQYLEVVGQKDGENEVFHNLGKGAKLQSDHIILVNEGLLTDYPYPLAERLEISTTHNQYFQLNLEDETVVPWFNVSNDTLLKYREEYDSWHHYYTYSKENITYAGNGHLLTKNWLKNHDVLPTDEEQRLLVNTLFRAFVSSNHAPIITTLAPQYDESKEVAHHVDENLQLHFKVEDFDLGDYWLDRVEVKLLGQDRLLYKFKDQSGHQFEHGVTGRIASPLDRSNQGGEEASLKQVRFATGSIVDMEIPAQLLNLQTSPATIQISAWDKYGALALEQFVVVSDPFLLDKKVNGGVEAYLSLNREEDGNPSQPIPSFQLLYTIEPKPLDVASHFDLTANVMPLAIASNELLQLDRGAQLLFEGQGKGQGAQGDEDEGKLINWATVTRLGGFKDPLISYKRLIAAFDHLEQHVQLKVDIDNPCDYLSSIHEGERVILPVVDFFEHESSEGQAAQLLGFAQLMKESGPLLKLENYSILPAGDWYFIEKFPQEFAIGEMSESLELVDQNTVSLKLNKEAFQIDWDTGKVEPLQFSIQILPQGLDSEIGRQQLLSQSPFVLGDALLQSGEGEQRVEQHFPAVTVYPFEQRLQPLEIYVGEQIQLPYWIKPESIQYSPQIEAGFEEIATVISEGGKHYVKGLKQGEAQLSIRLHTTGNENDEGNRQGEVLISTIVKVKSPLEGIRIRDVGADKLIEMERGSVQHLRYEWVPAEGASQYLDFYLQNHLSVLQVSWRADASPIQVLKEGEEDARVIAMYPGEARVTVEVSVEESRGNGELSTMIYTDHVKVQVKEKATKGERY